ncbi:hypothetical protein [Aquimarina megaterium]|uniref:hypothetical protein n=1 Tax=Aquimarina megaterium TaxID=1443666 RepID=UPI000945DEB9|nr:hypothetical protein [Aquimarina megaterium]
MIKQIENYLYLISEEINSYLINEFEISEDNFSDYSTFDFINFHLINKYIFDDKQKPDLFINLPKDGYRNNLFSSIFHSLIFIKLFQNYFNYEKKTPNLNKGDLIYCKFQNKKRVCEIKSVSQVNTKINLKFPGKNEYIKNFNLKGRNYTKINPNLSNGRNTGRNIDDYAQFLLENFDTNFPFITDFKNRTLVIADKKFFNEGRHLPIRYTNRNGNVRNDLPFFNYLVECCNTFNTAQKYLFDSDQYFDEIIIIGDSKYLQNFDSILHEAKYQGKVKNIILIGTEKPNTPNEFIEWLWSNFEVKISNNETPNLPEKVCLINDALHSKLIELKEEIGKIKTESEVSLHFMLKYTNFYFRIILVNSNISKGIFQEYIDRLDSFFKSEKFENELNTLFYDKNIYSSELIEEYIARVFAKFTELSQIIESDNLKWEYIKQQASIERNLFLLTEKKNYDVISNQLKREKIFNLKLISDKRIDNEKEYLDKWLNSSKNTKNTKIIIPYLNSIELFNKTKSIQGACEVLCYENIDEISYENVANNYHKEENHRLNHQDRLKFVRTDFHFVNEIRKRELDDIFKFDLENEKFQNNPYDSIDLPKEKVVYQINFDDDSYDRFDSTKGVFLVENKELIKTSIGEIYDGAVIRFYQNTSPKEFKRILKIFDTDNLLKTFDLYSESWKSTLKKLSLKFGSCEELYKKLFNEKYKINYNTFRLYFDDNSQTRFPRIKTLEVIKGFCEKNNLTDELIVKEFERFILYSKKDHSIRQQAGKILGNDLLDYVASSKTEISDSLKKISDGILDKLTETIHEKTVVKKTIIEDE